VAFRGGLGGLLGRAATHPAVEGPPSGRPSEGRLFARGASQAGQGPRMGVAARSRATALGGSPHGTRGPSPTSGRPPRTSAIARRPDAGERRSSPTRSPGSPAAILRQRNRHTTRQLSRGIGPIRPVRCVPSLTLRSCWCIRATRSAPRRNRRRGSRIARTPRTGRSTMLARSSVDSGPAATTSATRMADANSPCARPSSCSIWRPK